MLGRQAMRVEVRAIDNHGVVTGTLTVEEQMHGGDDDKTSVKVVRVDPGLTETSVCGKG